MNRNTVHRVLFKVVVSFFMVPYSCRAVLESVPYQNLPINTGVSWNNASTCFQHSYCLDGYFCSFAGYLDGWLRYGHCLPCIACSCDDVSIDGVCPLSRCPSGHVATIKSVQGSLYNIQTVVGGSVCFTQFFFEGLTFRQFSYLISEETFSSVVRDGSRIGPPDPVPELAVEKSQCSVLHGGLKGGIFQVNPQNSLALRYTDGYSFVRNATVTFQGKLSDSCPNIRLDLDRSAIPRFILLDAYWEVFSHPTPDSIFHSCTWLQTQSCLHLISPIPPCQHFIFFLCLNSLVILCKIVNLITLFNFNMHLFTFGPCSAFVLVHTLLIHIRVRNAYAAFNRHS